MTIEQTWAGAIHMHSDYSHDGLDSLETLRERCLERGIRFVGMTDHAEDFVPELFEEYLQHCAAVSDKQVRFIPGLEFRFSGYRGVHLLAFGVRAWIAPRTPDEFIEQTRHAAQLTVLAHPVLAKYQIPQVVLEHIDGIEVWNANYNTRYLPDPQAMRLYHAIRRMRRHVVATAGLDQHDSRNDRGVRVLVGAGVPDPLAEIKAGWFRNRGQTLQFDAHASFSRWEMGCLTAARYAFDAVERTQDQIVRTLRRIEGGE